MRNITERLRFTVLALAMIFAIAGCGDGTGNSGTPPSVPTLRYETVPYTSESIPDVGNNYNLVYSAHDNTNNYYLFLLGHVNYVPLAYRPAVFYDGRTPVKIGYSSTTVSTETVIRSVDETFTNCVTNSSTNYWNVSAEAGVKVGWFSAKAAASTGGTNSWDETNIRSITNTLTTATTVSSSITDSIEFTIGNNNEPSGKYRFSLFTTTDVYFVLVTNRERTVITDAYTAVCARPHSDVWVKDYDPDMSGTFTKTAEGDLLRIPAIVLSQLPEPEQTDVVLPENPGALPGTVTLNKSTLTLNTAGAPGTLTATILPTNAALNTLNWESSNPAVAVVDSSGKVTAVSLGTTTITVSTVNGKTAHCVVTVISVPSVYRATWGSEILYDDIWFSSDWSSYSRLDTLSNIMRSCGMDIDLVKNYYTKVHLNMNYRYHSNALDNVRITIRIANRTTGEQFGETVAHIPNGQYSYKFDLSKIRSSSDIVEIQVRQRKINGWGDGGIRFYKDRQYSFSLE